MILAAGRGTRLRPLTDATPKAMVPFAGKPLLEYVVRLLARHGFDDLIINLHHLPQVIADYFGDGRAWGCRLPIRWKTIYSAPPVPRGKWPTFSTGLF